MNKEKRAALLSISKQIVELSKKKPVLKMEEVDEARLALLNIIFQTSEIGRLYIDMCMSIYAEATRQDKREILMDGLIKLSEIVFGKNILEQDDEST